MTPNNTGAATLGDCAIALLVTLSVVIGTCAPAVAGGTVTMASQPAATMTHFSTTASELKFIPPFAAWPTAPSSPGFKAAERLYSLVDSADNLSSEVFHDEDSRCRSLAAVTFGLAESAKYVTRVAKLLDDDAVGIPLGDAFLSTGSPTPGTVGDVARRVLATRLGLRGLGDVAYGDPILTDSKAFLRYWRVAETPTALPSEWVFRMKTRRRRGRDIDDVKRALCENKSVEKWLVVPIVATFVEDAFTDDEVLRVLRSCPDRSMLKRLLDGSWRAAWMTLSGGPNSKTQSHLRLRLLRLAPKLFSRDDAVWIRAAAVKDESMAAHYIVAAARLDPPKGVDWLRDAIEKDTRQHNRCILLQALWSVGGEQQLSYIKDRYFAEKKPEYNAGGLQENLVERLGEEEGAKAAPLLKALVMDKRFTTLGWAATRAFAKNAELLLGEKTKEVKRYLGVEHRMGVYDFEHRPEERDKYLVDTKHVLMQTEAFQRYLQGEVLKRSGDDDDAK